MLPSCQRLADENICSRKAGLRVIRFSAFPQNNFTAYLENWSISEKFTDTKLISSQKIRLTCSG